MIKALQLYTNFLVKNPAFGVYALGAKILIGSMLYYEIRDKMRGDGEQLAKRE
jgi:hypothetical protein